MDKDLESGKVGTVGSYDLAFSGGKLVGTVTAEGVTVAITLDATAVLDALAKAIPGTIDDAIFGVIKAALAA